MTTPAERITADQLAWARSEAEGTCRICDAPHLLRLLLAEHDAVLADNERLTAQVADTRAKLAAAEKELDHRRGIRPCHRTAVHPGHLWMLDRKPVTCLGVKDAQPPAVAAPDAATRATVTDPDETRDGAQRGQEGPWPPKVGTGTTQARESARTPSAAPDANEAGR